MKGFIREDCSSGERVLDLLRPAACCVQMHGAEIKYVSGPGVYKDCDGLWTDMPGLNLVIRTADCNSVIFECPGQDIVMNLHAGWRGAAAGIVEKGVELLLSQGCRCDDMAVTVFPGMRECCFEVKEDLVESVGEDMRGFIRERDGRLYLDLAGYIEWILLERGIRDVFVDERCSCCQGLASHRRDGTAVRNCGFVRI